MILDILPVAVIIFALGGIIFIVSKKLPFLSSLDIDQMPAQKNAEVKKVIMEHRLKRKIGSVMSVVVRKPLAFTGAKLKDLFTKAHAMMLEKRTQVESRRKKEHAQEHALDGSSGETAQQNTIARAQAIFEDGRLDDAEAAFIEHIQRDPTSKDAFEGLARVYLAKKKYSEAEETLEYLMKIVRAANVAPEALAYMDIAEVKYELKKDHEAMHYAMKAVEIEPQNPKMLDYCLEMCLVCREKNSAWDMYGKLKKVNPENNKLDEFKKRLLEL